MPLANLSFAIVLNWGQFLAMFGLGEERPRFAPRWTRPMVPPAYIVSLIGAIGLFIAIPYAEELYRCHRAERRGLLGEHAPLWLRERHEAEPTTV